MSRLLAIFFGVGLMRPAPGTWGSAVALVLGMVILQVAGFPGLVLATALATVAGFWACAATLQPGQDPTEVVIDEVAGQWLALLFTAVGFWGRGWQVTGFFTSGHVGWLPWPAWVFPFALFRLFDIWKPGVIGKADRRSDPAGVMLDDLLAGLFAGIATVVVAGIYHGVMFL
jgi:phosphatidylglycerophosphatase A